MDYSSSDEDKRVFLTVCLRTSNETCIGAEPDHTASSRMWSFFNFIGSFLSLPLVHNIVSVFLTDVQNLVIKTKNWNWSPDLVGKKPNPLVDVRVWIEILGFVLDFIYPFLHFVLYSFIYEKLIILKEVMARKWSEMGNGSDSLSVPVRLEYWFKSLQGGPLWPRKSNRLTTVLLGWPWVAHWLHG